MALSKIFIFWVKFTEVLVPLKRVEYLQFSKNP